MHLSQHALGERQTNTYRQHHSHSHLWAIYGPVHLNRHVFQLWEENWAPGGNPPGQVIIFKCFVYRIVWKVTINYHKIPESPDFAPFVPLTVQNKDIQHTVKHSKSSQSRRRKQQCFFLLDKRLVRPIDYQNWSQFIFCWSISTKNPCRRVISPQKAPLVAFQPRTSLSHRAGQVQVRQIKRLLRILAKTSPVKPFKS